MINKINDIFLKNNFTAEMINDDFSVQKRIGNKSEYFIVREVTSLNVVLEKQSKYFKELKKYIQDKEVDKNATLLIVFKTEALPLSSSIYKQILEIEENPYYFRKVVLPYTQTQLNQIKDIDNFENIIKDTDKFEKFKQQCMDKNLSDSLYEIVSQLYIKLPFFKLPVISEEKNIILIQYRNSLNENEKKVLTFIENISLDEINNNDDFFTKLEEI